MAKSMTLYSHKRGPSPWIVAYILSELGLPYEHKFMDFKDLKAEDYLCINPNGKLPSLVDPNTKLTLWESSTIVQYLIEEYDTTFALSYANSQLKWACSSWLSFQSSGQGPGFATFGYFNALHPEKIPAAIEHLKKDVCNGLNTIDSHLKRQNSLYLVGDNCTYADLVFVSWAQYLNTRFFFGDKFDAGEMYPHFQAWYHRLSSREAVKRVMEQQHKAIGEFEQAMVQKKNS